MASSATGRVRHGPYPELTWHAVLVGYLLGILITVSIGYASLVLGFSIEGSELAAILGWGVLRGLMRRSSIVENNINQTVASAVNGASAGMMFSVPALFILNAETPGLIDFNPYLMVFACGTGGVLGIAFIIPLRKQMIDFNRLAYPGGIAVAAILKSPGAGMKKAMLLIGGAAVSAIVHFIVTQVVKVPHEAWHLGDQIGAPAYLNITLYLSLLTVGVGFLSGKGGLVFGVGGFICYWFLSPLLAGFGPPETQALVAEGPGALRGVLFMPAGIGILIGAAIGGVIAAFPLIKSAIQSMREAGKTKELSKGEGAYRSGGEKVSGGGSDEMPIEVLYAGIALSFVALSAIAYFVTPELGIVRAVAMALLGTLWIWIAGVIVSECLGRTNWSPLSGMTLIAVTILIFIGSGVDKKTTIIASVVVGAAICVAIAQAGDMMLDLKSGYLTGASPKKQQIGQLLATWLGPIVIMILIFVLHEAYGLGSDKLPAPQGKALASMIDGVTGGEVPLYRYGAGAGLGFILALSGLGGIGVMIGLGFYMPFFIAITYTIGNLVRIAAEKAKGHRWCEDVGIPVAAGLIVGEALVGVGTALVVVFRGAAGGGP